MSEEHLKGICHDCGMKHGKPIHEYGFWYHTGVCKWCGEKKAVACPFDYGNPEPPKE
jgi:putative FmdB family regulatory protein